jgi:hypothetical protein
VYRQAADTRNPRHGPVSPLPAGHARLPSKPGVHPVSPRSVCPSGAADPRFLLLSGFATRPPACPTPCSLLPRHGPHSATGRPLATCTRPFVMPEMLAAARGRSPSPPAHAPRGDGGPRWFHVKRWPDGWEVSLWPPYARRIGSQGEPTWRLLSETSICAHPSLAGDRWAGFRAPSPAGWFRVKTSEFEPEDT